MGAYDKRVGETLAIMETAASEWAPVDAFLDADGRPSFSFPAGHGKAPTPHPEDCCGLCGAGVKNAYWLRHDAKRWILPVGSECVARFGEGRSGEAVARAATRGESRALLGAVMEARGLLWERFSEEGRNGIRRINPAFYPKAWNLNYSADKIAGKADPEKSPDATIARWAKKNADAARTFVAEARALLAG